jgi:hypothetical protein
LSQGYIRHLGKETVVAARRSACGSGNSQITESIFVVLEKVTQVRFIAASQLAAVCTDTTRDQMKDHFHPYKLNV